MNKSYILKKSIPACLLVMFFTLTGFSGCEKNTPENTSLRGTSWKLAGIYDVQSETLQVLEPTDCADCYMLTFDTDTTAIGKSVLNTINLFLLENNTATCGITKIYESVPNANYFCDIIILTREYVLDSNILQLNSENYQIIFKKN